MGNCIIHESKLEWGGEDWSPALAPPEPTVDKRVVIAGKGAGFLKSTSSSVTSKPTVGFTEVKVKITKKQLEEIIVKVDAQGGVTTVQQVLAQLMKVSARYEAHQRTSTPTIWRPRLQTIPEITSSGSLW